MKKRTTIVSPNKVIINPNIPGKMVINANPLKVLLQVTLYLFNLRILKAIKTIDKKKRVYGAALNPINSSGRWVEKMNKMKNDNPAI